ncbi:MAG: monoterpene epsilon-lactone hydrolase [Verrucomicrobiales bacterium]|jgi:monoterpene epsilon-lactone hydrolase
MTNDGGMSPEALAYRNTYVPETDPIDFTTIKDVRAEAKSGFAEAVDRAIERHELELDDVVVGGIECLRIRSRRGGTANGSMLYVFGGAFIVGDPETDIPVIGALAELCGVEVIAPRYRLAPEHPAPAAGDDCFAVYRTMCADEDVRLLIAGESAGGNLALATAQAARSAGLRSPAALALLSPAADLRTERALFGPGVDADPSISYQRTLDIASVYPGALGVNDPRVSPIFGSMDGLPPTILTTGTHDLFLQMSLRLARKMRRSGIDVGCNVWPGMWHLFEFYDDFPESGESLAEIAGFLNNH